MLQNIKSLFQQPENKTELISEYQQKLKLFFPDFLYSDLDNVLNTIPFKKEVYIEAFGQKYKVEDFFHGEKFEIEINTGEEINFSYRIYFDEPSQKLENTLTEIQKQILNCIYTRHYNGYIREKRLSNLIGCDAEWVIPFKLQLLGEYVVEVLFELDKHITKDNVLLYKKLTLKNRKYWESTISRMLSYWDAFYKYPNYRNKKDYIGYKLMKRINKANC